MDKTAAYAEKIGVFLGDAIAGTVTQVPGVTPDAAAKLAAVGITSWCVCFFSLINEK